MDLGESGLDSVDRELDERGNVRDLDLLQGGRERKGRREEGGEGKGGM